MQLPFVSFSSLCLWELHETFRRMWHTFGTTLGITAKYCGTEQN